ncbi:flagellar motor protein MotA [Acetobacter sp. TBRC 12305]|uniref:Flagellar motor protein MotA n=1 Tax=Acetobacter garciniae TaxID=2817435 RepID=A0A939HQ45_9PROT|nr:flagellar motor protein MotA [Acetobacter garciniae]MBO1326781.1 flagellar motor protein MotA [Acetobacter garciniae]MBX0345918.1 flagellar motor protein MotA [Acetobacter garciniae]
MSKPTLYLLRMIAFLGCVAVVGGLLWRPLRAAFFNNPALDGLILGILAIGILWNIRMVLRLQPEVAWVETVRQHRDGLAQPEPPRMLTAVATALAAQSGRNRIALSTPAMQSLLDSLSGRLEEGREVSRYLTSLLIFLGLLGTFYGLLLTVSAIADVIAGMSVGNGDLTMMFDQLKAGLAKPLHGMGTAFSGSLFGLASALILGFLDLMAGQAQNRFFNDLEEWLASLTRFSSTMGGVEGDGNNPAYVQALLEQTAENLETLQTVLRASEEQRAQQTQVLTRLSSHLGALTGGHESEGERQTLAHMRNIEGLLTQLIAENERGRQQSLADIRSDLRLVARTVAAANEQNPR